MIDVTTMLIEQLVQELDASYRRTFGTGHPQVPEVVRWATEMSLEHISRSDALYHDIEHTAMVTHVGAEILRGRHLSEGGVTPDDWLHFIVSLLFHDIGYVRGVCRGDRPGAWRTGRGDESVTCPTGVTDAWMKPWHVDRGIRFARERFEAHPLLDVDILARNIDYTRFPIPKSAAYLETRTLRGLCRAADLIGQMADPHYLRKIPALFAEFHETGDDEKIGICTPGALRANYPAFFQACVEPYIVDAVRYLSVTFSGRKWLASLHDNLLKAGKASFTETSAPLHGQDTRQYVGSR